MATQNPSNAPGDLSAEPREDATFAAVLRDDHAGPDDGGVGAGSGPNSPIDVPLPSAAEADGVPVEDAKIRQDAVRQAASAAPAETHPSSR